MLIYNVTVNVEHEVHDDWFKWMREKHIPDVLKTGFFESYRMCKVMGDEDTGGITYAIQYFCPGMENLQEYQRVAAPALQQEHNDRYKDKFVAFRTLLEVID